MGRPLNIAFWFVLVVTWTLIFALGGPKLSSGTWLPTWFTSQGYNFPLNLITTVAELFIGFLVATAANRAQNALTALLDKIDLQEEQIEATETNVVTLIKENTDLTSEIHTLTTEIRTLTMQVLKNATLIAETHRQVGRPLRPRPDSLWVTPHRMRHHPRRPPDHRGMTSPPRTRGGGATRPLSRGVAHPVLVGELVQAGFEAVLEDELCRLQARCELVGTARPDDGRGDRCSPAPTRRRGSPG